MKTRLNLFLTLLLLSLYSCGGSSPSTTGTEDQQAASTAPTEEAAAEPKAQQGESQENTELFRQAAPLGKPFEKVLQAGEVSFEVRSPNRGQDNQLTLTSSGFSVRNEAQQVEVEGLLADAQLADLNADGYPEVYLFTISEVEGGKAMQVYAFASYRNRSFGPIYIPALPESDNRMQGYKGGDKYRLDSEALVRTFSTTDGEESLEYELVKGETSFVLQPRK
ncbi:hypothetical protein [Phaeodactylibacter luteus]|uniref:VCBS repeat-containing protein n=1 Tax=Phaeodactylibacter luteus TaxID=1564516 RepID=A0A5C6RI04_9BACT|nr:hypothetical protein [Phaeodactylibacter luteus]TXB61911.1 hypothetical protein FRY97_16815 [Phaeodactylibacter luteus]